jgi:hypothetical protein
MTRWKRWWPISALANEVCPHAGFPDRPAPSADEHRKLFVESAHELLRPALDAGAHRGTVPWPRALRIHRIGVAYSMTWSFAGPDGRALFRLAEVAGETVVVWLRAGNHGIYDS